MKMKSSRISIFVFLLLSLPALTYADALSENLVTDGGMEEWNEICPQTSLWEYLTGQYKDSDFSRNEKGNILIPKIFSQLCECKLLKPETGDVHSGQKALRLKGHLFLSSSSVDAYKAKDGDIYVARFWVKGEGEARMYLNIYGGGSAQFLEIKGKPEKGRWSLIEERILISGGTPATVIYPRLSTPKDVLFDDVYLGRVIREDERKLTPVPADSQERVAFAADAAGKITIDGRLDEPAWRNAVKFGGFRPYTEQNCLAPVSPSFRVLYDAENIYFGIECPLNDCPRILRQLQTQPLTNGAGKPLPKTDSYSGRESVELFIQPPDTDCYYQLVASLDGYRYDGMGKDGSWNGTWESAVSTADDRWFLELRIPVRDFRIERIVPGQKWRINICANQSAGVTTWTPTGTYFNNPDAFGVLIMMDFVKWCDQRPKYNAMIKQKILEESKPLGSSYAERLTAVDVFANESAGKRTASDWESITRIYARMNYVDYSYRCMEDELSFINLFNKKGL